MESLSIQPRGLYDRLRRERDCELTCWAFNQKVALFALNMSKVCLDAAELACSPKDIKKLRKEGNDALVASVYAQRFADQNVVRERELRWGLF